ncbi:DUF4878 domain-containing protein [Kushneria aurantia]|uniref:DUF4878 domain-containing protein n=1 Tax=Kushneria aurantia TaxID=504092 RepID=A0ABV6G5H0_9GAMM|nr:DUF4878 domain-containing protein [Kushneria aurantia]
MKRSLAHSIALLIMTLMLAACSSSTQPEETVERFFNAAAKGDSDTAIEQISFAGVGANDMAAAKGKIQMIAGQMQSQIESNGGIESLETLESTISEDGQHATVRTRVTFGNGQSTTDQTRLVKQDGDWKITL